MIVGNQDVEFAKITDESEYQRDGSLRRVRVYRFYVGKHGPFVEKVPLEPFDESEIARRVMLLASHLSVLQA